MSWNGVFHIGTWLTTNNSKKRQSYWVGNGTLSTILHCMSQHYTCMKVLSATLMNIVNHNPFVDQAK